MPTISGAIAIPVTAGAKPLTTCRYCELTKNSANRPKNPVARPSVVARSPPERKTRGSNSGARERRAWTVKAATSRAPTPNAVRMCGEAQPWPGPSTMPNSTATRPAVSSRVPTGSGLPCAERAVRGVVTATAAARTAANGTIAANSARQDRYWPTRPPPRLPAMPPSPMASVQDAIAWARRSGPARCTRMDIVAGVISAAPAPEMPRPAISRAGPGASALVAAPAANRARPASRAPLRPCRSPSAPAGMSRPAKTMT